jgi:CRISPR/Cas system-associated exonuclease Cas4 (RecB family)
MKAGKVSPYGRVAEVIYLRDRHLFPISWLHKQEYCEYQIFLENIKGIKVKPTSAMLEGKREHERLYNDFRKEAVPATFEQMLAESRVAKVISREFRVFDARHGIYGMIDEVLLTPNELVVIDDKPGGKIFLSNINQVYGYCLAFKEQAGPVDGRQIAGALRQRGTETVYWKAPFTNSVEESIVALIGHIHSLISGTAEFSSTDNPNRCNACRLRAACDRAVL